MLKTLTKINRPESRSTVKLPMLTHPQTIPDRNRCSRNFHTLAPLKDTWQAAMPYSCVPLH